MATEPFMGRWKVVHCISEHSSEPDEDFHALQGCEFELGKYGEVTWFPVNPASHRHFPLFECEMYEVLREREGLPVIVSLRFAAFFGHVIEFQVKVDGRRDFMTTTNMSLIYPGLFVLSCQQVKSGKTTCRESQDKSAAFQMLTALDEGFFADTEIISASGRSYPVHRLVLERALPSLDWNTTDKPLSGLPDDVLNVLLHFVYSQSFPVDVTEENVQKCIDEVKATTDFAKFLELAGIFKQNSALSKKIVRLVRDLYLFGEAIISDITDDHQDNPRSFDRRQEQLLQNPNRISKILRQSLKYIISSLVKLLHLGHLFMANRDNLDREEEQEIIGFAKSCLPLFLKQFHRFLLAWKFSAAGINLHIRQELAAYFVPELETFTELLNGLGCDFKDILEAVMVADTEALCRSSSVHASPSSPNNTTSSSLLELGGSRPTTGTNNNNQDGAGFSFLNDYYDCSLSVFTHKINGSSKFKSLKNTLQIKDLFSIKMSHRQFLVILSHLVQERDTFMKQGIAGKIRLVSWQIDQIIDELPLLMMKLKEFSNLLYDKLSFSTFKFCFVVGASFAENLLEKFHGQKRLLQPLLERLCAFVQEESLTFSLVDLGLLDVPPDVKRSVLAWKGTRGQAGVNECRSNKERHFDKELDLARRFCQAPSLQNNLLAQNTLKLFESKEKADMKIVIHSNEEDDSDVVEIACHRVILASRCPFFRRALMSGMKEEIERRIEVYDATPEIFTEFLRFVYSGSLSDDELSVDALSELLQLADRYDVSTLKELCETHLRQHIHSESALALLSVADHFNAISLKANCLDFVLENPELAKTETFNDLNKALQEELLHLITWGERASQQIMGPPPEGFSRILNLSNMRLQDNPDDELESVPLTHDSSRLEACVAQLRDIVGPLIDEDQLVQVALAADYDVNRAVNYILGISPTG